MGAPTQLFIFSPPLIGSTKRGCHTFQTSPITVEHTRELPLGPAHAPFGFHTPWGPA